jgi:hypothetical protein
MVGKASTRGRAPGCGGKAEVCKEADEDEGLRLGQLAVDIITLGDRLNRTLHQICRAPCAPRSENALVIPIISIGATALLKALC